MNQLRCSHCRTEVVNHALNPNTPADRDLARRHGWTWRRWNNRWVPACPTCTVEVAA